MLAEVLKKSGFTFTTQTKQQQQQSNEKYDSE